MVAMSELRLDLSPDYWRQHKQEADRVARAVGAVYRAYLRDGFDPTSDSEAAGSNRRRFEALVYFQRSFSGQTWRDTITLATAFELLLHDPSKGKTSKRIRNAIKRLSGQGDSAAEAFGRVYRVRNEIVHGGAQITTFDIDRARRAFVSTFLGHAEDEGLL